MTRLAPLISICSALLLSTPALADASKGSIGPSAGSESTSWEDVKHALWDDRQVQAESPLVTLNAPYRTTDDRRFELHTEFDLPPGKRVKTLSLLIDENPVPVAAIYDFARPVGSFATTISMRLNGPSLVRAVIETIDGELHMRKTLVKTSGLGACAAPPITKPEAALATLGEMELDLGEDALGLVKTASHQPTLNIRHPQHSGMQMDQISLLYIPARYTDTVEIAADDEPLFTLSGSISLSEDPSFSFTMPEGGSSEVRVRLTDTEEAIFEKVFPLGGA